MQTINSFYNSLKNKRVAFIGIGVTNNDCIKKFAAAGAIITLCDKKKSIDDFGIYKDTITTLNISLSLGDDYLDGLAGQDIIMRTPGFEFYTPQLVRAGQEGARITSEMELFFEYCPCKIVAVTGSDGKTTTTTLIAEMLKKSDYKVHLGGNLGKALLPEIEHISPSDIAVVELSSFQLISMRQGAEVAVVTNVTPNHLDHHKDMDEYINAKRNILLYQAPNSRTVLGYENKITRQMSADVKGTLAWFTRFSKVENGAYLTCDGDLVLAENNVTTQVLNKSQIALRGEHNIENLLAAMAAVRGMASVESMASVAREFAGVEHRIEPVRTLNGVTYYNDSIATSPTRVIAGLNAFAQKMIIIAGGYDKNIPFEPLAPVIIDKVKLLILTGATADKIEKAVTECVGYGQSNIKIIHAQDLEEAVKIAHDNAKNGDVVSLSPACASFDCYPNFEVRGKHYKELVMLL